MALKDIARLCNTSCTSLDCNILSSQPKDRQCVRGQVNRCHTQISKQIHLQFFIVLCGSILTYVGTIYSNTPPTAHPIYTHTTTSIHMHNHQLYIYSYTTTNTHPHRIYTFRCFVDSLQNKICSVFSGKLVTLATYSNSNPYVIIPASHPFPNISQYDRYSTMVQYQIHTTTSRDIHTQAHTSTPHTSAFFLLKKYGAMIRCRLPAIRVAHSLLFFCIFT